MAGASQIADMLARRAREASFSRTEVTPWTVGLAAAQRASSTSSAWWDPLLKKWAAAGDSPSQYPKNCLGGKVDDITVLAIKVLAPASADTASARKAEEAPAPSPRRT